MIQESLRSVLRGRCLDEDKTNPPSSSDYAEIIAKLKVIGDKYGLKGGSMSQYVHPYDNSEGPFGSVWMAAHSAMSFTKKIEQKYGSVTSPNIPSSMFSALIKDGKEVEDKMAKLEKELLKSAKRQSAKDAGKPWRR